MEYDQSVNFRAYKLGESIDDGYSHHENRIVAAQGFFLVYQICSIENDDTNAETFNFDLSKFYVVHNGKRYYHMPLQRDQFTEGSGGDVHYSEIDHWQQVFKREVQTAPPSSTAKRRISSFRS